MTVVRAKKTRSELTPQEETLRHKEVFEIYYAMGDARSLRLLSSLVNISVNTAEVWSSCFGWQDRVANRDQELIQRIRADYENEILRYRANYIEMIKEMISDIISVDPVSGKRSMTIKPKDVSDLEKLIKLHMVLMGDCGNGGFGPETPGGGNGGINVTIVAPQQLQAGEWDQMVSQNNTTPRTITINPAKGH